MQFLVRVALHLLEDALRLRVALDFLDEAVLVSLIEGPYAAEQRRGDLQGLSGLAVRNDGVPPNIDQSLNRFGNESLRAGSRPSVVRRCPGSAALASIFRQYSHR